ncbi:hypothetical protein ACLQ2R_32225 [Streptosporangium sp. DT93]|uniref:hypothetical protein n=1 Tax=Streptosporangium sp. DT93 TaxID=3393428 RepID=UPI003CF5A62A
MGLRHALTVLAEQWDDVRSALSPEDFGELAALVEELVREGDPGVAEEVAEEVADLLRERLRADHPVLEALRERDERRAGAALLTPARLRTRLGLGPPPSEVEREALSRLLDAPALTADEVRAGGHDPGDPGLIRLEHSGGAARWPAFQFAADGRPLPLVRTINRILEAADDPFGAADWWLGDNGWLGGSPARLMGRVPDERLISAARAETTEV